MAVAASPTVVPTGTCTAEAVSDRISGGESEIGGRGATCSARMPTRPLDLAVMSTVPLDDDDVVTSPVSDTVARLGSDDVHDTERVASAPPPPENIPAAVS